LQDPLFVIWLCLKRGASGGLVGCRTRRLDCAFGVRRDLVGHVFAGRRYVADVIAGWEPEELNARFEEEIGPDLQFIRINGALLGALIGGALYAVEVLLA
jgi:hypothetical protein